MMKSKITKTSKVVPLSELKEYADNPNVHPQEQVKAIAKSIETYGQYYPIVVDEEMNILCGHGKKLALELRGDTTGEVVILTGLTPKQKKKLVIEDNKIQSMSYVNISGVEKIIKEIGEPDIIGFSTDYLETIIRDNVKDSLGVQLPDNGGGEDDDENDFLPKKKESSQEDDAPKLQSTRTIICPHCGREIVL